MSEVKLPEYGIKKLRIFISMQIIREIQYSFSHKIKWQRQRRHVPRENKGSRHVVLDKTHPDPIKIFFEILISLCFKLFKKYKNLPTINFKDVLPQQYNS